MRAGRIDVHGEAVIEGLDAQVLLKRALILVLGDQAEIAEPLPTGLIERHEIRDVRLALLLDVPELALEDIGHLLVGTAPFGPHTHGQGAAPVGIEDLLDHRVQAVDHHRQGCRLVRVLALLEHGGPVVAGAKLAARPGAAGARRTSCSSAQPKRSRACSSSSRSLSGDKAHALTAR